MTGRGASNISGWEGMKMSIDKIGRQEDKRIFIGDLRLSFLSVPRQVLMLLVKGRGRKDGPTPALYDNDCDTGTTTLTTAWLSSRPVMDGMGEVGH